MQITSWWLQASLWMDMVLNREPSSSRGQEHTHPNPQLPAPNSQMRRRNPPPSQYDTRSGQPERTGSRSKHDIRPGVGELSKNRRWRPALWPAKRRNSGASTAERVAPAEGHYDSQARSGWRGGCWIAVFEAGSNQVVEWQFCGVVLDCTVQHRSWWKAWRLISLGGGARLLIIGRLTIENAGEPLPGAARPHWATREAATQDSILELC